MVVKLSLFILQHNRVYKVKYLIKNRLLNNDVSPPCKRVRYCAAYGVSKVKLISWYCCLVPCFQKHMGGLPADGAKNDEEEPYEKKGAKKR